MIGRDGIAALVVILASAALFVRTLGLAEHPLVPIGPGFYPRIVLGLTAALAAVLLVSDLLAHRARRRARDARGAVRPNYRLVTALFALFGLYVLALPPLGFRIGTFLFVTAAQALLDRPRSARRWVAVLAIALATTVVTYFVFERYLSVLLPRGRWTDF